MFQKSIRELFSIKSVHTLNCTFLISLLVLQKSQHATSFANDVRTMEEALDKGKSFESILRIYPKLLIL